MKKYTRQERDNRVDKLIRLVSTSLLKSKDSLFQLYVRFLHFLMCTSFMFLLFLLHEKNSFAERSKILLDIDLKIILEF